ncbi:MAG: tetratricopeptide repeat protein [Spirochaetia bacterium]|jgi:tetratricopeptide (TPR) repeat protein
MNLLSSRILIPAILAAAFFSGCSNKQVSQDAIKQYMQGEDFYVRGQVEAALAVFTRVAREHPEFHQACFMRGKALYLLNRPKEAEDVLTDLIRRAPRYHEAQIWLARIQIQEGKIELAEKLLADLLSFDSQDARLLYLMAQVKTDQGKLQDALVYLQKAVATEEELARAHIDLGRLYYRFGFDDKAHIELARVLLLLSPTSPLQQPVKELLSRIDGKG